MRRRVERIAAGPPVSGHGTYDTAFPDSGEQPELAEPGGQAGCLAGQRAAECQRVVDRVAGRRWPHDQHEVALGPARRRELADLRLNPWCPQPLAQLARQPRKFHILASPWGPMEETSSAAGWPSG